MPKIDINTYFWLETSTDNDHVFHYTDIQAKFSDESIISVISTYGSSIELESKDKEGIATVTVSVGDVKVSYDINVANLSVLTIIIQLKYLNKVLF